MLANRIERQMERPEELERRIVGQIIDGALAAGYEIDVNDGEETTLEKSSSKSDILAAMFSTDSDILTLYTGAGSLTDLGIIEPSRRVGSILLIWGNGRDVIGDYSDKPAIDAVLERAHEIADKAE
jgi:hypothetical protein